MTKTTATNEIWKNAFKSGGEVEGTTLKNGMQSKLHLSPVNTSGRATISYAITRAIIELASGKCSVAITDKDKIYIEAEGTHRHMLLYQPSTKTLNEYSVPISPSPICSPGYIHWSVFVPRIVEMYLNDAVGEFRNNFNVVVFELKNAFGTAIQKTKEFFVLNDFMYEQRSDYIQKNEQIQMGNVFTANGLKLKEDKSSFFGRTSGQFEYATLSTPKAGKTRFPSMKKEKTVINPEEYRLPQQNYLPELIPAFDLNIIKVQPDILCLATMVKEEISTVNPINNLLLYGEAGAGKSTAAKVLAQLWGIPYRFTNFSLNSEESELIGTYRPKEDGTFDFFEPAFVKTFRDGGVIELMEINYARPGALGVLNSALDDTAEITIGNGENVKRHSQCIIIATTNVAYAGCQQMNAALKDRFQEILEVEKMPTTDLLEVVMHMSGNTDKVLIAKMIDAVQKISIKMSEEQITGGICSTRQLINWARKARYESNPITAAKTTILAGVSFDKQIVDDITDTILKLLF